MKRIDFQLFLLVVLLSFASLAACRERKPPKTKEQVMQEKLGERIAQWEADLKKKCLERVMERAVVVVDSTIIANARMNRDTSEKLLLPVRPDKPEFVIPADTTSIRPLLRTKPDSVN